MTNDSFAPLSAMRWTRGTPRNGRILGPLAADHPYVQIPCLCNVALGDGTDVQLLAIGPAVDDDAGQRAHSAGEEYDAIALILHQRCITLELVERLDRQDTIRAHNAAISTADTKAELALNGVPVDFADVAHLVAEHMSMPVEEVVAELGAGLAAIAEHVHRDHHG